MEVPLGLSTAVFWLGNGLGPGEEKGCNFCLTIAVVKTVRTWKSLRLTATFPWLSSESSLTLQREILFVLFVQSKEDTYLHIL